MKFKMGGSSESDPNLSASGFSEADSSAPDAVPPESTRSRSYPTSSASGIFDVSRMNIRAQDLSATALSQTGSNEANFVKRAGANPNLIRGLAVAIALPLIAGIGYLMTADKEPSAAVLTVQKPPLIETLSEPLSEPARAPSSREALPKPAAIDASVPDGLGDAAHTISNSGSTSSEVLASTVPTAEAKPLSLVFDHKGVLLQPFSAQLDENGNEVFRTEPDQIRPFLPLGAFEMAKNLSSAQAPPTALTVGPARPFNLTEAERKRLMQLRLTAVEIRTALASSETLASSRSQKKPNAMKSLSDPTLNADAIEELHWLRAASFARDVSGDRTNEKRLLETLKLWARTYQSAGSALVDAPLLDALYSYDQVRHLWSTVDQVEIDKFFKEVVDAQFGKMKLEKSYTLEHSAHVRFATAVGYVTGSGAIQSYAQEQFRNHIQNGPLGSMDSFGHTEVLTMENLLHAAFVLERSNSNLYQNAKLNRAVDILVTASQTSRAKYVEALAVAAYFRPDLYSLLPTAALQAGVSGSRFGTSEGAILAAIRKPTTIMGINSGLGRTPSAVPTKLPPKRTK